MKRPNFRLLIIRATSSKGFPRALVAGMLLFASSCTSARQVASRFETSSESASRDPFVQSDGDITHADLVTDSNDKAPVTPLSHETSRPATPLPEHLADVPAETPKAKQSVPTEFADAEPAEPASPREFPTAAQRSKEAPSTIADVKQVSHPTLDSADPFLAAANGPEKVRQTSHSVTAAASEGVEQISDETRETAIEAAINFYPAEPRVPLDGPPGNCPPSGCPPQGVRPFPPPSTIGDEYLCDGGDKGLPVGASGPMAARLDPEDTVARYTDHLGQVHVEPSTETCVYAPRFAAVRTVSEPVAGHAVDRAAGTHEGTPLAGVRGRTVLDEQVQRDRPQGARTWARASGIETEVSDESLTKDDRHRQHVKLLGPHQTYGFIRDGQLDKVDRAFLQEAIQAAFDWSGQQSAMIYAADVAGQEVQSRAMAADMTGAEDLRTPGRLTLVKVADRKSAQPGDVVTFTLRFENTGDRELYNVRVVDRLTNRLKVVDGSVDSSANGNLNVTPNGTGGTVLSFEFTDPLPGHTGAYITFKCTVL